MRTPRGSGFREAAQALFQSGGFTGHVLRPVGLSAVHPVLGADGLSGHPSTIPHRYQPFHCDSMSRRSQDRSGRNTDPRRTSRPATFRSPSLSCAILRPLSFPLRSWHRRPDKIRNILSAPFQPSAKKSLSSPSRRPVSPRRQRFPDPDAICPVLRPRNADRRGLPPRQKFNVDAVERFDGRVRD